MLNEWDWISGGYSLGFWFGLVCGFIFWEKENMSRVVCIINRVLIVLFSCLFSKRLYEYLKRYFINRKENSMSVCAKYYWVIFNLVFILVF